MRQCRPRARGLPAPAAEGPTGLCLGRGGWGWGWGVLQTGSGGRAGWEGAVPCSGLGQRGALLGCPGGHEGGCRGGRKAGERGTCALPSPGEGGLLGCPWEVGVVKAGPGGPGWGSGDAVPWAAEE